MTGNWDEYNQSEKSALDLFKTLGYKVYDQLKKDFTELPARESEHQVILVEELKSALKRINPWINENNLNKAVNEIRPARLKANSLMAANDLIYDKLINHISLQQDIGHGKKNQTVKYIDFENLDNNSFIAINQFRVKGKETIKPDITLFVNGLPLAVIECKNNTTCNEPEEEAINQLRRYQNIRSDDTEEGAEELFYPNQLLVAAWGDSASSAAVGAPAQAYKGWKDPYPYNKDSLKELLGKEPTGQDILLFSLFKKNRFLDIIRNFTVFEDKGNAKVKMACRYQQYRAVQKAVERIKNAESLEDRNGTVWHTQGSGKSLTMLFLALKLRRMKEIGNPTMLIVTDRVDLDEQISGTFKKCGFPNPERAASVKDLKELLSSEAGRTIMTTIHKFQEHEEEKYPVLTERENVFVMADEAHRTQFKDLASNMRRALPNAAYIGFTGTPIDKESRSTLRTFGDYIDTYTIEESVADNATLPIKYESRLAELHVEDRTLDKVFDQTFHRYSDEEKQKIKEKYATENDIAEASSRIKTIALDIIKHYTEKIAPFKAQIVAVSRQAAVRYKEAIDELDGPETAVLISSRQNDEGLLKKYSVDNDQKSRIVERFKNPRSSLKIIIVCDMLLTGFDAPVEQVMYLDKSLKEHNLLQAIARVNRVYPEKNYGLVVDYYGVFDNLKKALAIFNPSDVENAVTPIEDEKPRLEANHREVMKYFRNTDMNDLEACIELFEDEEKRNDFKNDFKDFAKSMDIIMPHPIADPYRGDLYKLSKIHTAVRNRYRDDSIDIKGVGEKVKKLIDDHIRASSVRVLHEPVSILDEKEFEETLDDLKSDKAKASEMEHAIKKEINVQMEENPVYYKKLSERLEEIIEKRKNNQMSLLEQIGEMKDIINDMRTVQSKAEKLGLNKKEFALYELLLNEREKEEKGKVAEEPGEYTAGEGSDEPYVNKTVKEVTQNIFNDLSEYTKIDLWRQKTEVLQKMRKTTKVHLIKYDEFKKKYESLTSKIIKLSQNIFMF
jgi:type I restriction enzyme R subunit